MSDDYRYEVDEDDDDGHGGPNPFMTVMSDHEQVGKALGRRLGELGVDAGKIAFAASHEPTLLRLKVLISECPSLTPHGRFSR